MKKYILLLGLSLIVTTVVAQDNERKVFFEKQERAYYLDEDGNKKYFPNTKTQKMWNDILEQCPECLRVAEKYNVSIYQNTKYVKPVRKSKSNADYSSYNSIMVDDRQVTTKLLKTGY